MQFVVVQWSSALPFLLAFRPRKKTDRSSSLKSRFLNAFSAPFFWRENMFFWKLGTPAKTVWNLKIRGQTSTKAQHFFFGGSKCEEFFRELCTLQTQGIGRDVSRSQPDPLYGKSIYWTFFSRFLWVFQHPQESKKREHQLKNSPWGPNTYVRETTRPWFLINFQIFRPSDPSPTDLDIQTCHRFGPTILAAQLARHQPRSGMCLMMGRLIILLVWPCVSWRRWKMESLGVGGFCDWVGFWDELVGFLRFFFLLSENCFYLTPFKGCLLRITRWSTAPGCYKEVIRKFEWHVDVLNQDASREYWRGNNPTLGTPWKKPWIFGRWTRMIPCPALKNMRRHM